MIKPPRTEQSRAKVEPGGQNDAGGELLPDAPVGRSIFSRRVIAPASRGSRLRRDAEAGLSEAKTARRAPPGLAGAAAAAVAHGRAHGRALPAVVAVAGEPLA